MISSLLTLFAALLGAGDAADRPEGAVRRLRMQDDVIMKVPLQRRPPRLEWVERKGPKCIPAEAIRGAALSGAEHLDLMLFGGRRIRAELEEDCPALDFYGGFYLKPKDGKLCAGKDPVHSRMGGSCEIRRFRELVPKFRR